MPCLAELAVWTELVVPEDGSRFPSNRGPMPLAMGAHLNVLLVGQHQDGDAIQHLTGDHLLCRVREVAVSTLCL